MGTSASSSNTWPLHNNFAAYHMNPADAVVIIWGNYSRFELCGWIWFYPFLLRDCMNSSQMREIFRIFGDQQQPNEHLMQWALILQWYHVLIGYRKGSDSIKVNALALLSNAVMLGYASYFWIKGKDIALVLWLQGASSVTEFLVGLWGVLEEVCLDDRPLLGSMHTWGPPLI